MRRVVLFHMWSLDGVAEEPGDWVFDVDQAVFDNIAEVIGRQDAVLLGRGTYDYWSEHWPNEGEEPFRSFINSTTKHVFTSRPLEPDWSNTVVVHSAAAAYVRDLKEQDGSQERPDIGIHASVGLARSLHDAGLIDDYRLLIAPTFAGRGYRMFDGPHELRRLELVDSQATESGALLLHYRNR
jgi:dihydrofolate reductase